MSNELGPLDNIGVAAKLEEKGVSIGVRTRTTTAIDRLLGGLVDLMNVGVEGWRDQIKAANELKLRQILRDADAEAISPVVESLLADQTKKLENKIGVVEAALEALRENSESSAESEAEALDEDWLESFNAFSERARSPDLRQLWGQILASEARKVGSFSRSTLRLVSELDKKSAALFQQVAERRMQGAMLVVKEGDAKGEAFLSLLSLEEKGLISEVSTGIGRPANSGADGWFFERDGNFALRAKPTNNRTLRLTGYKLTDAGKEICQILPHPTGEAALRALAAQWQDQTTEMELHSVVLEDGKVLSTGVLEVLKAPTE